MSANIRASENAEQACRVLAGMITEIVSSNPHDMIRQRCLFEDFVNKCSMLPPELRWRPLVAALGAIHDEKIKQSISKLLKEAEPPRDREYKDVAIVTIIGKELRAAQMAFGIDINSREDEYIAGMSYWYAEVPSEGGEPLKVVIMIVGEARNSPCAIACSRLFYDFRVDLCLLCGIAAGREDKSVSLGDVVIGDSVIDYEGVSICEDGEHKRPLSFLIPPPLPRQLEIFRTDPNAVSDWNETYNSCYQSLPNTDKPSTLSSLQNAKLHLGVIVSGEKWIRRKRWMKEIAEKYHEKILAAEMEGSGFARACNDFRVPWLDFRGISDHGESTPAKEWHSTAAVASATAAVTFLKHSYRRSPIKQK